jgi:K+ transporter
VPAINASLFVTVLAIVIGFGSATALASAVVHNSRAGDID